jgi:aminoglycoside 3-N-acetyltransferase
MGPRSPWARLVEADARVVLLGVGFERCSIVHHGERLAEPPYLAACAYSAPIRLPRPEGRDERAWIEIESGAGCSEGFGAIEAPLRARGAIVDERVGEAAVRVVAARAVVELARALLAADPCALLCSDAACASCSLARAIVLGARTGGDA